MEHDKLKKILEFYRKGIFDKHEAKYLSHPKRDQYLAFFKKRMLDLLMPIPQDKYLMKILELYTEGKFLDDPLPTILQRIEKERVYLKQQQWFGLEYNQPFIPVGELVEQEGEFAVIKFIVHIETCKFFLPLINNLEQALKRGVIGEQEEKNIITNAKQGILPVKKEEPKPLTGFTWRGRDVEMKVTALYEKLVKGEFISNKTELKNFSVLFKGVPIDEPVQWRGTISQLLFLIGELCNWKLLETPEELNIVGETKNEQVYGSWLYSKVSACFINKQGKHLLAKNLKHTKNDQKNKDRFPAKGELLQNLVEQVAKTTFLNSLKQQEKTN